MSTSNYITNVAIVGAGGHVGSYITAALLRTGKHTVTALTRIGSQSQIASGVAAKHVDYDNHETLVEALRGQDALVITLGGFAPKDTDIKLVNAAGEAGVPWILPNEWAPDTANEALVRDVMVFQSKPLVRKAISELGKSSFIAVSTGFWYEWSLAIAPAFGIDLVNHTATLFDDGSTKIAVSTWPHVGRAIAALLSLPIQPSSSPDSQMTLTSLANTLIYTHSFSVSQNDMLASAQRITSTTLDAWTVTSEPSKERYEAGLDAMKKGDRIGFAKMLYTRVFFPDGSGDTMGQAVDARLGLRGGAEHQEDLDEATARALERAKSGNPWS